MVSALARPAVPLVDVRAARLAQTFTAALVLLAAALRAPALLLLPLAHLVASLAGGPRANVALRLFERTLRPRLGPGPVEDARPPRFANLLGAAFLATSLALLAGGLQAAGWALALAVGGLAAVAAATGFCLGCWAYRLAAPLRGVRRRAPLRIDVSELGAEPVDGTVVTFTHPLCTECHGLDERLRAAGHRVVAVDVSRRPELARRYGVALVPLAYALRADGTVERRVRV
jgi:hypothetical protein